MIKWLTRTIWPRFWAAAQKWQRDDCATWAASMGYYAAFSFFPLILVLLAGVGYVLRFSQQAQLSQDKIITWFGEQTSPTLAHQLDALMGGIQTNAGIGGPIGLLTLILGAIGIFTQVDSAFDRIWKIEADPNKKTGWLAMIGNVLLSRLRAFLMLLGLGLLILTSFVAGTVAFSIVHFAHDTPLATPLYHLASVSVSAFLNMLFFTLVYWLIPKRPVAFRQALDGGLLAGVAWEIGRQLMTKLLVGNTYSAYGVVGALIVLMLWIYYASNVLLFGAEFVEVCSRAAAEKAAAKNLTKKGGGGAAQTKPPLFAESTTENVSLQSPQAPSPPSIRPRWRG